MSRFKLVALRDTYKSSQGKARKSYDTIPRLLLKGQDVLTHQLIKISSLAVLLIVSLIAEAESYEITINIGDDNDNAGEYYQYENAYAPMRASPNRKKTSSWAYSLPKTPSPTPTRLNLTNNKNKYTDMISNAAIKHRVDVKLLHAVIRTESAYNASAISSAGAMGLMQLMPDTARRYGVSDRSDPMQNIDGGTRYLKYLLQLFDSDVTLAVAAYNAGENAVIRNNNSIPPYSETQEYVKRIGYEYQNNR